MTSEDLALLMLTHADRLHPEYTREQRMMWCIGMLSDVVIAKNSMDSVVFTELNQRIDALYQQRIR